jgi:hypothetical protein
MEQQTPIATRYHVVAIPDKADSAIPQIVAFPTPSGNIADAEQAVGDLAVGCALDPPVDGTQGEDEAVSACLGKRGRIGTRIPAVQAAPKADRGGRADFKQLVEWQKDGKWLGAGWIDMHAKCCAFGFDDSFRAVGYDCGLER